MNKRIAFTFDDIPSYETLQNNPTARMLQTLRNYGGKGTLFLVGSSLRKYGVKIPEQALTYGFELANHTDTHRDLTKLTRNEVETELAVLQDAVQRRLGVLMRYMRPPGLRVNDTVFSVTRQMELPVIFGSRGSADLSDWNVQTPATHIRSRCLNGAYDGQIVLMHGYSEATASVLEDICRTLSCEGYTFVTLSELFAAGKGGKLPCDRPVYDLRSGLYPPDT